VHTLGNSYVGKTSLNIRFIDKRFDEIDLSTTLCRDFRFKVIELDSKVVKMQVWDTQETERFRAISSVYYKGAQGVFVVYDVTDRASFIDAPYWLNEVRRRAPQDVVLLLLGNKSDLEAQRAVSFEEGKALADEFRISFMETSLRHQPM
jgi:Ras-related protein Rab-1A